MLMKKIFTICTLSLISFLSFSQSSMKLNHKAPLFNLPNDSILIVAVTASTSTQDRIDIQNTSAVTKTFLLHKMVIALNNAPLTDLTFCFGGACFGAATQTAQITLPAGIKASQLGTNYFDLYADYQEGTWAGYSYVKYTFKDVANMNDSMSVRIKYNPTLAGVKSITNVLEFVSEVYPNPSNDNASLSISLKQENDIKIQIYNCIGAMVYNGASQKYSPGKNKVSINCSDFNSGLYFVSVLAGDSKISRRLIVNK